MFKSQFRFDVTFSDYRLLLDAVVANDRSEFIQVLYNAKKDQFINVTCCIYYNPMGYH